ncbi:hypothetical protein V8E36_007741 [Tilletia maclaganii]
MADATHIDTLSLADALGDKGAQQTAAQPKPAQQEQDKSKEKQQHGVADNDEDEEAGRGGYVIGDEPDPQPESTADGTNTGSPETLTPVSARSLSPVQPNAALRPLSSSTAAPPVAAAAGGPDALPRPANAPRQQQSNHPESVHSLHAMFPDLDLDTIALVLDTKGGDTEAAINALLQMNDPSFHAPTEADQQLDADAALAVSIAAEQDRDIDLAQRHQQQQQEQRRFGPGRGGGGAFSSLFGGGGGGASFGGGSRQQAGVAPPSSQPPSGPSYDPSKLTYQPRVRKPPPSAAGRAAYNAPPPSRAHDPNQSLIPGLPGPNEAKQWQEDFNRFAEVGISKAASTISALKAKAAASFGGDSSQSSRPSSSSASSRGSRPSQQQVHRGLTSPNSFDHDAATVGEDELAQILARGSSGGAPRAPPKDSATTIRVGKHVEQDDDAEEDGLLDWGGAAKTKSGAGASATSSARASSDKPLPAPLPASSGGPTSQPGPTTGTGLAGSNAAKGAAIAAGGAAVGGAAAIVGAETGEQRSSATTTSAAAADPAEDSDEEEYVSNPFADDD